MITENNKFYVFALCSPDSRYPGNTDWYLKVTKEDRNIISDFFENFVSMLQVKFGYNPHYFNQHTGEPAFDYANFFHPTILSGRWILSALDFLEKYETIFIGNKGQMFPANPSTFILHSEKSSPVLAFPTIDPKEYITIAMWKDGKHFYLESSIGRVFSKAKYDTITDANTEASRYVDKKRIRYNSSISEIKINKQQ